MMKQFYSLLLFTSIFVSGMAQTFQEVTIQEIQTVTSQNLAACNDTANFIGDTIITYGTVVMDALVPSPGSGGTNLVPNSQAAGGRNIWIQSGTGPFSGIDLFTTNAVLDNQEGVDILNLVSGDSVKITGIVAEFRGESEILPLNVEIINVEIPVSFTTANISDINDENQINKLETGEQWEGVYVEFLDVTVSEVNPFNAGGIDRVSFTVTDDAGNKINVSDRFLAQRLPAAGGSFVEPVVGTVYTNLRGVIAHSKNGCDGTGRGYELYPFAPSDYVREEGSSPPIIFNISRNGLTLGSDANATITATIEDTDGSVVKASIFYSVGEENDNYIEVSMTAEGSTYSADIPAAAYNEGDIVKYYISATDDDALVANAPDVPGVSDPIFFIVRDNGIQLRDVQYTFLSSGRSGYTGLEVTVTGIVTASAEGENLGYVYIQQEGEIAWAGISLVGNSDLATLKVGDEVEVTGTVEENFGFTRIADISSVSVTGTGSIPATEIDPSNFSEYSLEVTEQYEGMLMKLANPQEGGSLIVVDVNADQNFGNFGEYRIGTDEFNPDNGSRVLAGRQSGNAFSSLNVPYVNSVDWANNDGVMNVEACVVSFKDTFTSVTGIMYYSFGENKLLPRNEDDFGGVKAANCPQNTVSIAEELAKSEITVFPNPVQDQLRVDYTLTQRADVSIQMLDLTGRIVSMQELDQVRGNAVIATSNLANGTYLLIMSTEGEVFHRTKVLIAR
ncbi:MAG: T9SS type A sorting domain-containing protein [Bacteroidota bacterium]